MTDFEVQLALRRKEDILRHLIAAKALLDISQVWHFFAYNDGKQENLDNLIKAVDETFYPHFKVNPGQ